jgi:teichuronic acid biosynthesis glycosyltransferase TuaG
MSNHFNVKVSVITPVYNGEKYLEATILSVLNQSFKDFEFLLIDHASTDSSPAIMQRYKAQDDRIQIIRLDINKGGPAYPRNEGLKVARGEYVAFVDADDVWKENKLQIQTDYLDANPQIDMLYSQADIIDENGTIQKKSNNQLLRKILSGLLEDKVTILYTNFVNINTLMIRNENLTFFREEPFFIAIEDWMFHILNFRAGKKGKNLDEYLINYRIHGTALSNRASDISYRKIFYMLSLLFLEMRISFGHFCLANILNSAKLLRRKLANGWSSH